MIVVNNEDLRKKIGYLGMAVSKNVASKQSEKMIKFDCVDGVIYAYTSDGVNNIRVEIGTSDKDFYAIVDHATFSTFIKSCDGDITLDTKDKFMHIKSSNVKCKIPTYNHELKRDNKAIPDPTGNYTYDNTLSEQIDLKLIKSMLNPDHIIDVYSKIYFGNSIMVSDTDNVIMKNVRVFNKDILLDLSSVEILAMLNNVEYTFITENKVTRLCIKSDELYATMVVTDNDNNDFQYTDFLELFETVSGSSVLLDTSVLVKAMNASALFKVNPIIVFNPKGIFVQIDAFEFIYKISDVACEDRKFELSNNLVKMITTLGKDVTIYYTNEDLIKCEADNIQEILSVVEVKTIGK